MFSILIFYLITRGTACCENRQVCFRRVALYSALCDLTGRPKDDVTPVISRPLSVTRSLTRPQTDVLTAYRANESWHDEMQWYWIIWLRLLFSILLFFNSEKFRVEILFRMTVKVQGMQLLRNVAPSECTYECTLHCTHICTFCLSACYSRGMQVIKLFHI